MRAERFVNGGPGGAEGFDLRALQFEAGFERFANEIVAAGFVVMNRRRPSAVSSWQPRSQPTQADNVGFFAFRPTRGHGRAR